MKKRKIETDMVHFSEAFADKGALNVPIYQNSTFRQKTPGTWEEFTYTRTNNPTEEALRKTMASLENGLYGIMFASGLAAINAVMELLATGDHVVSTADIYGGTHRLFTKFFQKRGMSYTYVDTSDLEAVARSIKTNTKMVYVETPSNPLLRLTDLLALSKLTKEKGILLVVDNTIATPYFQRPLDLGADIVIHSTSKYLSGHTNVIGGAVVANDQKIIDDLKFIHMAVGGVPSPFDCYLTMSGIKTLSVRMKQHAANARRVADYLGSHNRVTKVYYPGLPDHPQHALAKSQMSGFSGILSFELDGNEETAKAFLKNLELFALTVSFGSVTSLVDYPAKMSHKEMLREERLQRGFSDSLIRLSVGIENDNDLIDDIENALSEAYKG